MSRMKGYPRWFPGVVHASVIGMAVSGLLLAPTTLDLQLAWDMPWRLPGGARIATAATHLLFSLAIVALLGALASVHMRIGWKQRRHRVTGAGLMILLGVLTLSAVGIYYFGDATLSRASSVLHLGLGALMVLLFAVHVVLAWRERARS
jgi:hypothetical protein